MLGNGRSRRVAAVAAALAFVLTQPAGAAPGDLDPSFGGGDGRVAALGVGPFVPRALAIDSRRRLVVAGYVCEPTDPADGLCLESGDASFEVVRLTQDGGLDPEFGDRGSIVTDVGESRSQALDVTIDDAGRIVVAGTARSGGSDAFALVRYLADGTLDTAFGTKGAALTRPPDSRSAQLNDVEVGPGGTLLGTGPVIDGSGKQRMVLARFGGTGFLDASFGAGGLAYAPVAPAYGLTLGRTSGGRLLAAGAAGDPEHGVPLRLAVMRTLPGGALDPGFGGDGYAEHQVGTESSYATAAALTRDGSAVLAGATTDAGRPNMLLGRVSPAGGFTSTDVFGVARAAIASDLVIDGAGRALLAGQAAFDGSYRFAALRVRASGARDTGFGTNGAATIGWSEYPVARATAAALQTPDRLVMVGIGCNGGSNDRCAGGTSVLLAARLQAGEDVPAIRTRVARHVSRSSLRHGLRVRVRLAHRARCEAWLLGRRRGSGRRVLLAHVRASSARARFTWRLHPRRLGAVRAGNLRLLVRAGTARASRTVTLTR